MCVVSNMGDMWRRDYPTRQPWVQPYIQPVPPMQLPPEVTKEDLDELKRDLEALKKLLRAAKIYDEETGQPDCEADEKVALIKRLADLVGVDLEDIFTTQ